MRTVVTIHGIGLTGGQGEWQTAADHVLHPHFLHKQVKYPHYRWAGPLFLMFEPWVAVPWLTAVFVARMNMAVKHTGLWCIVGIVLAHFVSYFRRQQAAERVFTEIASVLNFSQKPHAIAHSMGTHFISSIMKKFPQARFADVIYAGCVLPCAWSSEVRERGVPRPFERLRNEVGRKDYVALLAYVSRGMLSGFGMAGYIGFETDSSFTHTILQTDLTCPACNALPAEAAIHNVILHEFGHSDVFLTESYVACFWLPYLWGIEPTEYSDFLGLCLAAYEHRQRRNWNALLEIECQLLNSPWRWAEGKTLADFIESAIVAHPRRSLRSGDVIKSAVLAGACESIAMASEAYRTRDQNWATQVLALNPTIAIVRAVDVFLI